MKTIRAAMAILILSGFLAGCDKEGVCVKSTGKVVREQRPGLPFHYIEVHDNINLFLTSDTTSNEIIVEAGENLVAGILTSIDSGRLVLRNENSCDWLRSFEVPVNVYIRYMGLDSLITYAAGNISCTNAWTHDSAYVNVIEGAGNIDLLLEVSTSTLQIRYGTVRMDVSGYSGVTFISSSGYGPFHAENLESKFTYVYTFSPNDVFVFANEQLGVEIANIGDVYYTGNPKDIDLNAYGGGKLKEF
jgi:hypothetical protein